jgi:hypothetical protein
VVDLTSLVISSTGELIQIRTSFWKLSDLLRGPSNRDLSSGNLRTVEWHEGRCLDVSLGLSIGWQVAAIKLVELCRPYKVFDRAYDSWSIHDPPRKIDLTGLGA